MPLFINSNISSLNAQRHLTRSGKAMARAFERLSSGFRINSAADDAAGLAISSRMTAQIRSLNMATRNTNDGISLVQTAESAMYEATNILERMRELAVQAANDTNTLSDRLSLQGEIDQLLDEITRIGDTTEYNTEKLLDGTFSDRSIHVGAQKDQTIEFGLRDFRSTALGSVATSTATSVGNAATGTIAISPTNLSIQIELDDGSLLSTQIDASDVNDDAKSTARGARGAIAKAAAINKTSAKHHVVATAEETQRVGEVAVTENALDDIADGELYINDTNIGPVVDIQDADASGVLQAAINAKTSETGVTASVDTNGKLVLTAEDGRNIVVWQNDATTEGITGLDGNATTDAGTNDGRENWAAVPAYAVDEGRFTYGGITLTSNEKFTLGGDIDNTLSTTFDPEADGAPGDDVQEITIDNTGAISRITVTTKADANDALAAIDRAIDQVSEGRADLGSLQNRFESVIANLQAVTENLSAARSRIRDADFSQETAELTRSQIIQQAGVAILAQANAAPQAVLALLAG